MVGGRKEGRKEMEGGERKVGRKEFSLQPSRSQVSGLKLRNINWLSDFSIWKEILSESGDLKKHSWET